MTPSTSWRRRRHRGLFWTALLAAVVLIAGGTVYAYRGYRNTRGADGAVRGYLHALARGDAPTALSYGDLPAGSKVGSMAFLTSEVLHQQLRLAPIRDIAVGPDQTSAAGTSVPFTYSLAFGRGDLHVQDSVTVRKVSGRWKLERVAVSTEISMKAAIDRATLAGAAFPSGETLLFPGAVPVEFDTPFLQLTSSTEALQLNQGSHADLTPELTPAATSAIQHQLAAMLKTCGHGGPATQTRCPVPSPQFVPGSMSGNLVSVSSDLNLTVGSASTGILSIDGNASFDGTYRMLDFNDVARTHRGKITVPFTATAYAVPPLSMSFTVES